MDTLKYIKNQILEQNLPGKYIDRSRWKMAYISRSLGLICIVSGLILGFIYWNIADARIAYDSDYEGIIHLKKGKYNLYIEIEGFYQNDLSYEKSISYDQLSGKKTDLNLSSCYPYDYAGEIPYYPAGAVANSFFQDKIEIEGLDIETEGIVDRQRLSIIGKTDYRSGESLLPVDWDDSTNSDGIPLNTEEETEGLPVLDERFLRWIDLEGFSKFRKLWGIIFVDKENDYPISIESRSKFPKKHIYIGKKSMFGVKNYSIPLFGIAIGFVGLMVPAIFRMINRILDIHPHEENDS